MTYLFRSTGTGLVAETPAALDWQRTSAGAVVEVSVRRPRNVEFLRKYFKLVDTAYHLWDPQEFGENKDLKAFRQELAVRAGYYDIVVRIDGTRRKVPRSIAFASMKEDEFEALYSKTVDVILELVLTNYTREDLDNAINQIMEFA